MTDSERVHRLAGLIRDGLVPVDALSYVAVLDRASEALAREEDAAGAELLPSWRSPEGRVMIDGRVLGDEGYYLAPAELARRLRATAAKLEAGAALAKETP